MSLLSFENLKKGCAFFCASVLTFSAFAFPVYALEEDDVQKDIDSKPQEKVLKDVSQETFSEAEDNKKPPTNTLEKQDEGSVKNVESTDDASTAQKMIIKDGMAEPFLTFSDPHAKGYSNANSDIYRFCVYVETDYDTDLDGKPDLIKALVQVPKPAVEGKYKAPIIYSANPYSAGVDESDDTIFKFGDNPLAESELKLKPAKREPQSQASTQELALQSAKQSDWAYRLPYNESLLPATINEYSYFLVRGFASVHCAGLGTYDSEGFETCGSDIERDAFKSVVEWLTGSRKAYTDRTSNIEISSSDWSSGLVAMQGCSYPGATAYAVATTGVEGLKTIIPEAAPSNWYTYVNSQGVSTVGAYDYLTFLSSLCSSKFFKNPDAVLLKRFQNYLAYLHQQQENSLGRYSSFWEGRDWTTGQSGIKASGLLVAGMNDHNVSTKNIDLMRDAFARSGAKFKTILHQFDHQSLCDGIARQDSPVFGERFSEILNIWLVNELLGYDTALPLDSNFSVQSNIDGTYYGVDEWDRDEYVTCALATEEAQVIKPADDIATEYYQNYIYISQPTQYSAYLAMDVTKEFTLAGKVPVHVRIKPEFTQNGELPLMAILVDACDKPFNAFFPSEEAGSNTKILKGIDTNLNPTDYNLVDVLPSKVTRKEVAFGAMSLHAYESGYEPSSAVSASAPPESGKYYDCTLWIAPTFYTFKPGHRLEIYLVSSLSKSYVKASLGQPKNTKADLSFKLAGIEHVPDSLPNVLDAATIDADHTFARIPILEDVAYTLTSDKKQSWKKGSEKGIEFAVERSLHGEESLFNCESISINGKDFEPAPLAVQDEEVMKVQLSPEYLNQLEVGTYNLNVMFENGKEVAASFTIKEGPASQISGDNSSSKQSGSKVQSSSKSQDSVPKTGDSSLSLGLGMGVSFIAALSVLLLIAVRRRVK